MGTRQGFKVQKPRDTSPLRHPSLVSAPRSNYICQSITEQMQVILMKIDSGTPSQKGRLVTNPGNLLAGFKALSHSQCGQSRLAPRQQCVTLGQEDPSPEGHRGRGRKAQLRGGRSCGLPFAQPWVSAVVYTQRGWAGFIQGPCPRGVGFSNPPQAG